MVTTSQHPHHDTAAAAELTWIRVVLKVTTD